MKRIIGFCKAVTTERECYRIYCHGKIYTRTRDDMEPMVWIKKAYIY
jgi:hypothetical protein